MMGAGSANLFRKEATDRNTIVNHGALVLLTHGSTEDTRVYGTQIITGVDGEWETANGHPTILSGLMIRQPKKCHHLCRRCSVFRLAKPLIPAGLRTADLSAAKGGWSGGQWVEQDALDWQRSGCHWLCGIHQGGEQIVEYYADAVGTLVNGGTQPGQGVWSYSGYYR